MQTSRFDTVSASQKETSNRVRIKKELRKNREVSSSPCWKLRNPASVDCPRLQKNVRDLSDYGDSQRRFIKIHITVSNLQISERFLHGRSVGRFLPPRCKIFHA